MFAHDLAFANRFNWNCRLRCLFQNLAQRLRCPARRILFHRVMSLNDLRRELGAEDFRGAASQSKERVYSDTEVRRKHDWQ